MVLPADPREKDPVTPERARNIVSAGRWREGLRWLDSLSPRAVDVTVGGGAALKALGFTFSGGLPPASVAGRSALPAPLARRLRAVPGLLCGLERASQGTRFWWEEGGRHWNCMDGGTRASEEKSSEGPFAAMDWEPPLRGLLETLHALEPIGRVRTLEKGVEFHFAAPPGWARFCSVSAAAALKPSPRSARRLSGLSVRSLLFDNDGIKALVG